MATGESIEPQGAAEAESSSKDSSEMDATNDVQQFKEDVQKLLQKQLVKGDTWYLLDIHWYKQWKKHVGLDTHDSGGTEIGDPRTDPGPIDNSPLFKDGELREHMIDELDYVLVPEEAWEVLVKRHGVQDGQSPVARKVVEHGMFVKHCKVEVYFIEFQLADNSDLEKTVKRKFSKSDTLETIEKEMRSLFEIPDNVETRLWNKYTSNTYEQLTNLENTVQDTGLFAGQLIVIERQNTDGSWPRAARSTNAALNMTANDNATASNSTGAVERRESTPGPSNAINSTSTRYNFNSYDGGASEKAQPGKCGLSNLGNTCFMNSIIQGLSNCPPITEYFANDNYVEDINEDNPLGMKGEIARNFGEMIKSIWSGRYSYVVPRNFKMAVGRFAPQFSGYQQQDSQELLTFLLDGLHEDLNRIKKKPYIEMSDSDNRPDEEVAGEAWENYKKRNDSVILDLFHGLLKSTVVCPECPKISVTFDPFCYLSLPLPVKKERQIELFLVHMDQSKCPTQYKVTVPKNGCMRDLCEALGKLSGIDPSKMVATDVYNHRFHKIYAPEDGLQNILDRDDIFVYEVPTTDVENPVTVIVPIYLRERKTTSSYSPSNLFGQPLLIGVPKENTTYEDLYNIVLTSLSRYVTPPAEGIEWWKSDPPAVNGEASSSKDDQGSEESSNSPSSEENRSPLSESDPLVDDDMMSEEDDKKGPPKLFTMNYVNSYGNAQLEQLNNDGQPLKISGELGIEYFVWESETMPGKNFLALDWHPKAKSTFYNEKAAEDFAQDESFHAKPSQKKQVIQLDECLELYTNQEKLGENDAWYCPQCKKHQQATKKFDLWSLPEILVISLKRFSYNRYWRDKLDTFVDFPIKDLDLSPYIINANHGPAVYDLVAVSNHYGGMGGGHYTAYAKNKDDGQWYYFDDSSVTASSEDQVVTKAAYVLFYMRRDVIHRREKTICNGQVPTRRQNGETPDSEEDMDVN